jgi:hypothetical protein
MNLSISELLNPSISDRRPGIVRIDPPLVFGLDKPVVFPIAEPSLSLARCVWNVGSKNHYAGNDANGVEQLIGHRHDSFERMPPQEFFP